MAPPGFPLQDEAPRSGGAGAPSRILSPEAQRALEEAKERREKRIGLAPPLELGGRGGLDPARYGDWEVKGLASDF